jgi:hypothetical protein
LLNKKNEEDLKLIKILKALKEFFTISIEQEINSTKISGQSIKIIKNFKFDEGIKQAIINNSKILNNLKEESNFKPYFCTNDIL